LELCSLVDGEFVRDGKLHTIESPYLGEGFCEVSQATKKNVDTAITVATEFANVSHINKVERKLMVLELARLLEEHSEEICLLESFDTGRSISTVKGWDIVNIVDTLNYYAGIIENEPGELIQEKNGAITFSMYKPLGVCVALTSWNFPLVCLIWKIAPALAAGCPIIVKPSEHTPLSALFIQSLIYESNFFPKGMIQFLYGSGPEVGQQIISDERIKRISLTGGSQTAKLIMQSRGNKFGRVSFELGGKSALVITESADIDKVSITAVSSSFGQQGQDCGATSLIFIHEKVYDEFRKKFLAAIKDKLLPGDPLDPNVNYGPLIGSEHRNKVIGYIQDGVSSGGVDLADNLIEVPSSSFLPPVVFEGLRLDAKINCAELFGPITSLQKFDSLPDVAGAINKLGFGLFLSVWSNDKEEAFSFCNRVDVANYWINTHGVFSPSIPWGGINNSGIGADNGKGNYYDHMVKKIYTVG
jgi:acyl-CoA reductase-like NAD-dependent aldehyde dehydrogenase